MGTDGKRVEKEYTGLGRAGTSGVGMSMLRTQKRKISSFRRLR